MQCLSTAAATAADTDLDSLACILSDVAAMVRAPHCQLPWSARSCCPPCSPCCASPGPDSAWAEGPPVAWLAPALLLQLVTCKLLGGWLHPSTLNNTAAPPCPRTHTHAHTHTLLIPRRYAPQWRNAASSSSTCPASAPRRCCCAR
jgi:hypothetical protein